MSGEIVKMQRSKYVEDAITFWKDESIKKNFIDIMLNYDQEYHHPEMKNIIDFIKKVAHDYHRQDLKVPVELDTRAVFEDVVEYTGIQLYVYLKQVYYKLEKFEKEYFEKALKIYIDNVYWTKEGRIDYEKIFFSMYDENKFPSEFAKYFDLCVYSFEDKMKTWFKNTDKNMIMYIHNLVTKRCNDFSVDDKKFEHEYDYYLMAYWMYRHYHKLDRVSIEKLSGAYKSKFYHFVTDDKISEGNMFALCAFYGHFNAAKYFWERMYQEEKDHFIIETFIHAFMHENGFDFYGQKMDFMDHFFNKQDWSEFRRFMKEGKIPFILVAIILALPEHSFFFPSMEEFKSDSSFYLPKASEVTDKDLAFGALVSYMKKDYELTYQGEKIKKMGYELFKLMNYTFN